MTKRIEIRNQAELDACIADGNVAIVMCTEWVVARGSSHVEARESSHVEARESSHVEARGSSHVVAWGSSHVVARESSHVVARESSHVEARESSHVVARESSHVEAWESSHVEARESSHVVAWGNVFVRLFSASEVTASSHVVVMNHGTSEVTGGMQVKAMTPITGSEWCEYFGINPKKVDFAIPNIDAVMLKTIQENKKTGKNGLYMGSWHGDENCNETNWCNTTHCRAGYAVCLAGKAGFDLERKVGPETAGQMIYAVSRPTMPLPDFHASDKDAMADIIACAAQESASE